MRGKTAPPSVVESSPAVKALRTLDQLWARVDELERNQAQDEDQIRTLEIAYRDLQITARSKKPPTEELVLGDLTPSRFRSDFPPIVPGKSRRRGAK